MNRRYLLALLCLGLVFSAAVVRADDDGEEGGGEAEEAKPTPKKAVAQKKAKAKAAPSDQVAVDALAKLPVEPLAMDAAALKDDDRLFDQFPKQLSGDENVESLTVSLKKAAALLQKMKRDVEGEKVWTKNVYDIIQNYQYKYLKTVKDVQMREAKIAKMERLVSLMKQSTLHSAVERELEKASKVLSELVTRGGSSHSYDSITSRMNQLKSALKTMPRSRELFTDTTAAMQHILSTDLPPHTGDAVRDLANGVESVKIAEQRIIEQTKPAVSVTAAAKPAAAKPAAKPKPAAAKPKPAAAKPKKVTKPKKGAAKPKAKKPVKKAAAEEDD